MLLRLYFSCIYIQYVELCVLIAIRIPLFQTRSSADADKVPFHMLGIVSCCAIVALSLRHAGFLIYDFKKCHYLEIQVRVHRGHWRYHRLVEPIRLPIDVLE